MVLRYGTRSASRLNRAPLSLIGNGILRSIKQHTVLKCYFLASSTFGFTHKEPETKWLFIFIFPVTWESYQTRYRNSLYVSQGAERFWSSLGSKLRGEQALPGYGCSILIRILSLSGNTSAVATCVFLLADYMQSYSGTPRGSLLFQLQILPAAN